MFENWGRELRFALRRLRSRPTYAALTILTLALGVAGTSAVYAIAGKLLLDPLPVRAEEEIVNFWMEGAWSEAEFVAMRPEIRGFESLALFRPMDVPMQPADGPARLIPGAAATAEIFRVLGVGPAMGPGFRPGDVVINCYSYHLTPAGSMFETGLHHLDCAVIPGGVSVPVAAVGVASELSVGAEPGVG